MAIEYDDILLNIGSKADPKGIQDAIDKLVELNKLFDGNAFKGMADASREVIAFVGALKSIDKNIVNQYKSIADSLSKIGKKNIKALQIEKPKEATPDNLIHLPEQPSKPIELIDLKKQREELKALEDNIIEIPKKTEPIKMIDLKAEREAVEEVKRSIAEAKATVTDSGADNATVLTSSDPSLDWTRSTQLKQLSEEYELVAEAIEKDMALLQKKIPDSPLLGKLREYKETLSQFGRASFGAMENQNDFYQGLEEASVTMGAAANSYAEFHKEVMEAVQAQSGMNNESKKVQAGIEGQKETIQSLAETVDQLNAKTQEVQDFQSQVASVKEYLRDAPQTGQGWLKNQGFSTDAIKEAKQQLYLERLEEEKAAKAAQVKAEAEAEAAKEAEKYRQALQDVGFNENGEQIASFLDLVKAGEADITDFQKYGASPKELREVAKYLKETQNGIKGVAEEADKAKSPLQKLVDRFKSMMVYRAFRQIISGIASAIKEGFTNLEQWDIKEGNTGFAESMARARESLEVLKNSLAVVGAPFLEFAISLLEKFARLAMAGANMVSRLIAILGGKGTYRAVTWPEYASKATDDYGHSLGKASDKAKEFKRQLMGFDEINNLTAPSDTSGGSGGGSGAAGGGFNFKDMFEELEVGDMNKFEEIVSKIGEAWRTVRERIFEANDASSGHLNSIKKVWEGWKEFFNDPQATGDEWLEKFRSNVKEARNNISQFVKGFKDARANGANLFEAIQAGFDAIDNSKVPEEIKQKFEEAIDGTESDFKVGWERIVSHGATARKRIAGSFMSLKADGESSMSGLGKTVEKTFTNMYSTGSTSLGKLGSAIAPVSSALQSGFATPLNNAIEALRQIAGKRWSATVDIEINEEGLIEKIRKGIANATVNTRFYTQFASGGFPTEGEVFIAREAGPELVGTIGGQTAVANNADIVNAVAQGVASAVSSVMSNGNQNVTVVLEGDARGVFKLVQSQAKTYAAQTGKYAFA